MQNAWHTQEVPNKSSLGPLILLLIEIRKANVVCAGKKKGACCVLNGAALFYAAPDA